MLKKDFLSLVIMFFAAAIGSMITNVFIVSHFNLLKTLLVIFLILGVGAEILYLTKRFKSIEIYLDSLGLVSLSSLGIFIATIVCDHFTNLAAQFFIMLIVFVLVLFMNKSSGRQTSDLKSKFDLNTIFSIIGGICLGHISYRIFINPLILVVVMALTVYLIIHLKKIYKETPANDFIFFM